MQLTVNVNMCGIMSLQPAEDSTSTSQSITLVQNQLDNLWKCHTIG